MEKIILTDADGCLVNWNDGFKKFAAEKGMPQLPGTDTEYSISARHGVPPTQAVALVREFNEGPHIADLGPLADSVEYVTRLAQEGFRFIVVTSISDAPQAHYYRTTNLFKLFGKNVFTEVNCLPMGSNKAKFLQRWADMGYFWIEDHVNQAEAGHEAGLKAVLIEHPYNSHFKTDLFPAVSNSKPWEEIYHMVRKEYNLC